MSIPTEQQVSRPSTEQSPPILLLIDLQEGLVTPLPEWDWGPRSTPKLEETITHLLSTWRSNSWPVIHVNHDDIENATNPISAGYPDPQFSKPHSCSAPEEGEKLLIKTTGSAFVNTGLDELIPDSYLRTSKRGKLVVVGMDGAQCVNNTTRHGSDLGYEIVVVADACASYGMDKWGKGGLWASVDAEETNELAMGMLRSYAAIVSCEELSVMFHMKIERG